MATCTSSFKFNWVLLLVLLLGSQPTWGTREVFHAESDESSMLAKPPILKAPKPAAPAPDVAAALAALAAAKAAKSPAPPVPAAPLASPAPPVPASAPDLAAALLAAKAAQTSAKPAPPAEAAPAPAPDLAADLAALRAAMAPKAEEAKPELEEKPELHTVQIKKQYVPVPDKTGKIIAYKTAYFGNIHVGGPSDAQDFTVVFDTGSAHLVLPSVKCKAETCLKHKRYNSSISPGSMNVEHDGTSLPPGEESKNQVSITFGTGTVKGTFVQDDACLGASGSADAGCSRVNMVVAEQMSDQPFSLFQFDGILGLGLEALGLAPSFSFFGQMIAQRPSMQPQFSVFLARSDDGYSSISFGGHDASKAATNVNWADVAMPELGYWQVQVRQVRVGDMVIDECADGSCRAILDTGTSLLGAPRQALKGLHSLLSRDVLQAPNGYGEGEGQVTEAAAQEAAELDCRQRPGAAPLIFDLGEGLELTLESEDYFRPKPFNMTMPDAPDAWKLTCRSLLLPLDLPEPLGPRTFILGEPVLRKYYTIYDWASRKVGFAMADHSNDGISDGAVGSPETGSLLPGAPLQRKASSNEPSTKQLSAPAAINV